MVGEVSSYHGSAVELVVHGLDCGFADLFGSEIVGAQGGDAPGDVLVGDFKNEAVFGSRWIGFGKWGPSNRDGSAEAYFEFFFIGCSFARVVM